MKKIKVIVTILYVLLAVEVLSAFEHTSTVRETIAYVETSDMEKALQENRNVLCETGARILYAGQRARELARCNEYYAVTNEKEEKERDAAWKREQERRRRIREKKKRETEILERIVEAEAGDQDIKGRIMVANVILNRVKSSHFPDSIKRVVFAHRQFSPVQNGRYYCVHVSEKTKRAVKQAQAGKDYSGGALYFMCRSAANPSNVRWFDRDLTKVKEYGCHEFFK